MKARCAEAKAAGVEIADGCGRGRREGRAHPRQPAEARGADRDRRGDRGREAAAPHRSPSFRPSRSTTRRRPKPRCARPVTRCSIARSRGTGAQARTKDLVVYASGDAQAINALMPVFADFSRQAHDLGAFGNGMKMKFVANLLVAIHNVASAEAMVLGMKAGLDPAQIFKLIQSGAGNSRVFELRAPMMVEDRYDGDNLTMRISTWQKDMKVIGEYAASVGCPTPLFSASEPIYRAAMSTGYADEDTGAVCAVLEAMAVRVQAVSTLDALCRNPRRHAHRLGCADHDGRRPRAARGRLPPDQGGQVSGHPHLRPLREGPRVPGRLSERVAAHGGEASRRRGGLVEPLSKLGSRRPGEMGAARLCLRARRLARRRLLARLHRSFLAARDQGLLRLHRMGRRAAVVERQGRAERHLVLRHQPVARRVAAAAASRRDVRVGGRGRLVSRHDASRRHALDLLGQLVRHAGEDRAVRRGRARQALARARRTGVRAGDA